MTRAVEVLDTERLGAYLTDHVDGFRGPVSARKFPQGQSNPTFLLEASSGRYVLRRKPPGKLLASAHAVDREYRVMTALADTGVPVPRTLHLCSDEAVIGSMFFVMSYEEGRIFWDPALPDLARAARSRLHEELVRVLAALHDVDPDAVGLGDFGRPGNYFARQTARWTSQYRASATSEIEAMERLIEWLPASAPADDGAVSVIHGDYRIDNVIIDADRISAVAVLDWELSTLGHPLADLAYYCMCLRLPAEGLVRGLGGRDREALGVPGEDELVAAYCGFRGLERIEGWNFYLAFSFFRLAAICQGVYRRALDGNASSERALEVGRSAGRLATAGAALIA